MNKKNIILQRGWAKRFELLSLQGRSTASLCAKQFFSGGIFSSAAENVSRLVQFFIFVLLWKGFAKMGVDLDGFSESDLLTYTLISFVFHRQLDILTPATSMLWEGSVVGRYTRPMPIYLSYFSETVGRWWIPSMLLFSLPLVLISPLLGISILPSSTGNGLLFLVSLCLSIVIGYGVDILFAAFAMRLKNGVFLATQIRYAIYNVLSGALIPFALFPKSIAFVFSLLPFGSIANAPLSIYVGMGEPIQLLAIQAFWSVMIWVIAHRMYKKSEERMVSYGG